MSSSSIDKGPLCKTIQAGLVQPTRFADGKTSEGYRRNWSIYVFFRILSPRSFEDAVTLLKMWLKQPDDDPDKEGRGARRILAHSQFSDALSVELGNPSLRETDPIKALDPFDDIGRVPKDEKDPFRTWLKLILRSDKDDLIKLLRSISGKKTGSFKEGSPNSSLSLQEVISRWIDHAAECEPLARNFISRADLAQVLSELPEKLNSETELESLANMFADSQTVSPNRPLAIKKGLVGVLLLELLNQVLPALQARPVPAPIRSEFDERDAAVSDKNTKPRALNLCFTHSGFKELHLHPETLASFPEAFRDGMAARADRLGDTDQSAPEHWYGELGQTFVHGLFTGGFPAEGATESDWESLRTDIHDFNVRTPRGRRLREKIGGLFRIFGMEIVHIELGEKPYHKDDSEGCPRIAGNDIPDFEHFGFRDGLSQPFVDLSLKATALGGGVPRRNRTWAPVAPGEIFLGRDDEDGRSVEQPVNQVLRDDGTYIVFRKLEQDLVEFRNFVSRQYPESPSEQDKLMASFVGRWKSGADLVRAPHHETEFADNDFLYAEDDPNGRNCPLSAHIRRANPRDIGGRGDAKRHRLLRRSLPYGGSLIPETAKQGDRPRGLLFIAANSRIEMQFELVQGTWLNSGEFLGQAGIGKCPLTGTHAGSDNDTFLQPNAVSPVRGLPSFVRMQGGEYFFMPSIDCLNALADEDRFVPDMEESQPPDRYATARHATPSLFDPHRLHGYVLKIFGDPRHKGKVTVQLPKMPGSAKSKPSFDELGGTGRNMSFIAKASDIRHVLGAPPLGSAPPEATGTDFSVLHYHNWGKSMAPGVSHISGTDDFYDSKKRKHLNRILQDAYLTLQGARDISEEMRALCRQSLERTLRRTSQSGEVDLVRDIAADACHSIMKDVYGISGPDHISELATALPFARQHIGQLYPEWLQSIEKRADENPSLTTLQFWAALQMVGLVGNVKSNPNLTELARKGSGELRNHIRSRVDAAFLEVPKKPRTFIDAFAIAASKERLNVSKQLERRTDVTAILAELTGFFMGGIPSVFGQVMEALLNQRVDFGRTIPILKSNPQYLEPGDTNAYMQNGLQHLILETLRLHPTPAVILRYCEKANQNKKTGTTFVKGEWVACLMNAANRDPNLIGNPNALSLYPWLPGAKRPANIFTAFGPSDGMRQCWGRFQALQVMGLCMEAVGEYHGIRRVAGRYGDNDSLLRILIGLRSKFEPFSWNGWS